jgi:two-component system, sensor histidine kinase and response regulator
MSELDGLRTRFGQVLVILLWLHVPVVVLVAVGAGRPALLAAAYHLTWRRRGSRRSHATCQPSR